MEEVKKIVNENRNEIPSEKRTAFQWLQFLIPYVYAGGIVVIVSWMIVSASAFFYIKIKEDPKVIFLQQDQMNEENVSTVYQSAENKTDMERTQEKDTWMSLIVKPIIASPLNKIIFRGIFLLVIWMLLFLVIPVAFRRLKRIKFFNFEFELENIEQAAIETVEISGGKAKLMAYLTSEQAAGKTLSFLNESSIDFKEVLHDFLAEIQVGYRYHFEAPFSYHIYTEPFPKKFTALIYDLIHESKETKEVVIKNKENNDNLLRKNYLIYYFHHDEKALVTILSSYQYQFDIFDKYLIELLHNSINKNIENIEYMVTLTSPTYEKRSQE